MAKKNKVKIDAMNNRSNCKKTTIGNGRHSRVSRNKHATRKMYKGQGR